MAEIQKKAKKYAASFESSNSGIELDISTQKQIEAIDLCQSEIDNLNEKASKEIMKIEIKYNALRKPYFEKRNEIIKSIPNFWVNAIMNHPDLSLLFDDTEEACLHYLTKIDAVEFDDILSGYQIHFYFAENPYFENSVLTKEFRLDYINPSSQSTPIKWREGACLLKNTHQPIDDSRKRHLEKRSFFGWFVDNIDPTSDDIAEIFKDDLYQNPLQYYLVADMENSNEIDNDEENSSSGVEEIEDDDDIDSAPDVVYP